MATVTQREQARLETNVSSIYAQFAHARFQECAAWSKLWRHLHAEYLERGLDHLPASFGCLDSSRPWLCFWILHSLAIIGEPVDALVRSRVVKFLRRCQDPRGSYAGGPGQMAHMATTYSAICSLVTVGGYDALASINREKVLDFLLQMKDPSGGFRMHENGEIDIRGCYTAIAVAHILDVLVPPVVENVGQYIASCQTYEGGIGGEPGAEAHGGYTFCGLAAAMMVGEEDLLDLPKLLHWAAFRQGKVEGGFQGRTNKLVDGCYSYWQGNALALCQKLEKTIVSHQCVRGSISRTEPASETPADPLFDGGAALLHEETYTAERLFPPKVPPQLRRPLFNIHALQAYLLLCCQTPKGGLIDKPGKPSDYYHTCYCLSGLSVAQHSMDSSDMTPQAAVFGAYDNLVDAVHPLVNVQLERYKEAREFFRRRASSHADLDNP